MKRKYRRARYPMYADSRYIIVGGEIFENICAAEDALFIARFLWVRR